MNGFARYRQKNLFLLWGERKDSIILTTTRKYSTLLIVAQGWKLYEINNYPVFQTSVIILGHVKRRFRRHVNSIATDKINDKASHFVTSAETCIRTVNR